jgi:enduracididine biosynthesis enzyme MppQ
MPDVTTLLPGVTQFVERPGIVDLGPGYLQPSLLPVAPMRQAMSDALEAMGPSALSYGANRGPAPFLSHLAARATRANDLPCTEENVLVTAGASQMLHYLSASCCSWARSVLVEEPTYDLAVKIFRSCHLEVVPVRCDEHGMVPDALHAALRGERAAGRRVGFVYVVPTFHNPTGRVMPLERRERVLEVARGEGLLVVEDNAYLELSYDAEPPPTLLALAGNEGVVQVWSFSKTLGPGLRLGWIVQDAESVARMGGEGLLLSGGGLNHVMALAVSELYASGAADRHVAWLRQELVARRDALLGALGAAMPAGVRVGAPRGGYFAWVELPAGLSQRALLAAAEEAGISFALGSRFGTAPGQEAIRLSFTFNSPDVLQRAAELLGGLCRRLLR